MGEKDPKSRIGKAIREIRESAELEQTGFGERVGVSQSTVSAWEKGDRFPTLETVYRIQEEFGVTLGRVLPDLHDGAPTPTRIAEELEKLAGWARGEAVEWEPTPSGRAGGTPTEAPGGEDGDRRDRGSATSGE